MASSSRRGLVLWFTGYSGSGKTALSLALADELRSRDIGCQVIDGDVQRADGAPDHRDGFSREGRRASMTRTARIARKLKDEGWVVLVSKISPYAADRAEAMKTIGESRCVMVWLSAPLHVCESRDPKGLYFQARQGAISNFTGVSDPYEEPGVDGSDVQLPTHLLSEKTCVKILTGLVEAMTSPLRPPQKPGERF